MQGCYTLEFSGTRPTPPGSVSWKLILGHSQVALLSGCVLLLTLLYKLMKFFACRTRHSHAASSSLLPSLERQAAWRGACSMQRAHTAGSCAGLQQSTAMRCVLWAPMPARCKLMQFSAQEGSGGMAR